MCNVAAHTQVFSVLITCNLHLHIRLKAVIFVIKNRRMATFLGLIFSDVSPRTYLTSLRVLSLSERSRNSSRTFMALHKIKELQQNIHGPSQKCGQKCPTSCLYLLSSYSLLHTGHMNHLRNIHTYLTRHYLLTWHISLRMLALSSISKSSSRTASVSLS
jgi:hypothetical protein